MHWSLYVLMGGAVNAFTNYGYKLRANKPAPLLFAGLVFLAGMVGLTIYGLVRTHGDLEVMREPSAWLLALAMGIGTAGIISAMMAAFKQAGPISLVDPMWACIYSLSSVALGLVIAFEKPSKWALLGIGLYLVGAYLMAHGKAQANKAKGRAR